LTTTELLLIILVVRKLFSTVINFSRAISSVGRAPDS
jgi:hypothetical protein